MLRKSQNLSRTKRLFFGTGRRAADRRCNLAELRTLDLSRLGDIGLTEEARRAILDAK